MHQYQIDNLIAVGTSFIIVLTITLLVLRTWRRAFEARHELRRQLLEKLPPEELGRMLATEEGRLALAAIVGDGQEGGAAGPLGRGAMLVLVGSALGISAMLSHLALVGIAGLIALAAGIGQFVIGWLLTRELRK